MSSYPKARWSVGPTALGASVWTQQVPEGGGGGYYLYKWERGANSVTVEELAQGATKEERRQGGRSVYAGVGSIPVPASVNTLDKQRQEIEVARIIYADMRETFGEIADWITYDTFGNPVWFHKEVTGG